ncbi:DUF2157 domain-containing protein [Aquabacterium sp. A7-Y]|uniref:DUF2157 domain-containing protein n=1 Tax=Aquabacterium sp. A7-Y TaxID=1349605 RepID=UPI00223E2F71|nr:DUF2157 domain-containing protein [Aquabacterium sp. A7-Y]MCW7539680.1 DUF2157 domain-containing protein [Aquabacterium sp. A7-Y]
MNLRLALYELAERHRLDRSEMRQLHRLAGLASEPAALSYWLPRVTAVLAAALGGLGLIFWIAANWETLGRFGRFALLQGLVLVSCLGALWRPGARAPLAVLAFLGVGALFGYFGQTYQTGADPWQLFALWAVLALPLCLTVRSDVVWTPWALVAMTAISLWVHAHSGHRWRVQAQDLPVHLAGWTAAVGLVAALGPALRRYTGAGMWAQRTALTLAVVAITATALGGLFHTDVAPHYALGTAVLALAAFVMARPLTFDIYGLSAAALGCNVLLVAGLARWLFDGPGGDAAGDLFVLGLLAAGLLAGTVTAVLGLARRRVAVEAGSQA